MIRNTLFASLAICTFLVFFTTGLVVGLEASHSVWVCMADDDQIRIVNSSTYIMESAFNLTLGQKPWSIDFTPDGGYAFVVCRGTNNVVVIDAQTREEVKSIGVGKGPFFVRMTADGGRAFVTNTEDDTISVIRVAINSVEHTFAVGDQPIGISFSKDGENAYVCLKGENKVAVVRLSDFSVISTVDVGADPWGVDVTPDGRHAYVSCEGDDTVHAIRLSDHKVIKKIPVNEAPRGVSVLPSGDEVYVPANEAVAIIDAVLNNKLDASGIHGHGWEAAITPDGAFAFVTNGDYHGEEGVEVIDTSRMEKIETIFLGENTFGPHGISIHPIASTGMISTSISCITQATVAKGAAMTVSGRITPPLEGKAVTLEYSGPDGSSSSSTTTTSPDGRYTDSYSTNTTGEWEVRASWTGDDEHEGASSSLVTFTVERSGDGDGDEPGPVFLIIGMGVIVIAVVAVARRRGRKS